MTDKNRQYETMTRIERGGWTIRVWRKTDQFTYGPDFEVQEAVNDAPLFVSSIADAIDALPDIEAYEILDESGNGALVYPDWRV